MPGNVASQVAGARCVVTGGLGFIDSNLTRTLAAEGADVVVIDALVPEHGGAEHNLAGLDGCTPVEVLHCEIGDSRVRDALAGADIVFNVAGQVSHIDSMYDPLGDLHLNTISHAAFLEHLRSVCATARVIHTSTRQVYGVPRRQPVDETHAAEPVDVNGVAKLAGEQLHMVYAHAHRMAITSLRLTNVYGPRQRLSSDRIGFFPVFLRRALRNEEIRMFGDGSQRRDCLYVDDVVAAMLSALDPSTIGQVYNVGHPDDASLLSIAEMIVAASGSTGGITCVPWPDEAQRIDIGSFRTDGSKLEAATGWRAVGLSEGIADTVAFYRGDPWYLSSI